MAVLRSLVTTLGLNSAQFRQELGRARQEFTGFMGHIGNAGKAIVGGMKTITSEVFSLRTALVALGSGAAIAGIKATYESLDQSAMLGRNIGIAAGQWSAYSKAAEWAGSNGEKLADVIKDLNVKIAETAKAGGDSGPFADFFNQIGESAQTWSQLSPEQQLSKFTAELQKMSATDARFFLDSLNDSAVELFDTLYTNHGELLSFVSEIQQSGMALSDGQFAAIKEARLELSRLTSVMGSMYEQVQASLAPAISEGSKLIRQWITDSAQAKGGFAELGKSIAIYIIDGVERASRAIQSMMEFAEASFRKIQFLTGSGVDDATKSAYWQARQNALSAQNAYLKTMKEYQDLQSDGLAADPVKKQLDEQKAQWDAAEESVKGFLKQGESSGWDAYYANLDKLRQKIGAGVTDGGATAMAIPAPGRVGAGAIVLPKAEKPKQEKQPNYSAVDSFRKETLAIGDELAKRKALLENSQKSMADTEAGYRDQRATDIQIAYGAEIIEEQNRWTQSQRRLQEQYAAAYDAAAGNSDLQFSLQMERYNALEQLEQDHQTRILQIEQDRVAKQRAYQQQVAQELLSYTQQTMSITTDAMQQAGMEHTGVYKALFAMQKAAAIPSMIVATEEAATKAMAAFPPPYSIGLATAVRAMGYTSIGMVAGQALAGMAHDGIDNIPKEGTWLLDKGERVVDKRTNSDLKDFLSGQQSGTGGSGTIIQHFHFEGVGGDSITQQIAKAARDGAQQGYAMVQQDFATRGSLRRMLNV